MVSPPCDYGRVLRPLGRETLFFGGLARWSAAAEEDLYDVGALPNGAVLVHGRTIEHDDFAFIPADQPVFTH
ncbi:MAG: hypothetical protein ACXWC5_29365, partial [Burkholderiales bacterium]